MIYTINFYVAKAFYRYILNVISKSAFLWLLIYLDFIWIDYVIQKVVRTIFYIYFCKFITPF